MKKLITMVALSAIAFGSVYAHGTVATVKTMQTDTTKKKTKTKTKKDSTQTAGSVVLKKK